MGNYLTHPTSLIQTNGGEYVFVGTWHESFQATVDQSFWMVKTANIQSASTSVQLLLQIAVVVAVAVLEVVIIISYVKGKTSKAN
jgi:hypothetical protein